MTSLFDKEWPADKVERWPIKRLIPYARNARLHTNIDQIVASVKEWGWTIPVLAAEDGGLIAGHARVLAARKLGLTEIPVMVARGWTEAQRRAYILADNQLTLNGSWDNELLRFELGDLKAVDFDISTIGFGDDFLADLLADRTAGLTDPDDVPEVPEEPVSRTGDLWIMGRHRLLCGDATVEADVKRLLNGVAPHLMVTDPPYGVEYDPDWRNRVERRLTGRPIGAFATGQPLNDDRADWREAWALFPGDVVYSWCPAGTNQFDHYSALIAAGFDIRMQIIWAKNNFAIGRGHYHVQHEPCWYAVRKAANGHWKGDRSQTTLWRIDKPMKSETGHAAQKPVECMRRPIENNSSPGQAVYDPFLGSGTTCIAAEQTGRACYALEIAPQYVGVSVERWQNFTGEDATLEGDGRTFAEVAAERLPDKAVA